MELYEKQFLMAWLTFLWNCQKKNKVVILLGVGCLIDALSFLKGFMK